MAASFPPNVHISTHPCLRAKLSRLRSKSTNARDTQTLIHEITTILSCEALAHALKSVDAGTDETPLGYTFQRSTISPTSLTIVPILRSGLSMVEGVQGVLPDPVAVHHLGMYREKSTLQPVEYYNNLPYHKSGSAEASRVPDVAVVVDPIIATGSTVCAAIDTLRDWGVPRIISISVLACEDGMRKAAAVWPEGVEMWVGAVDLETDERGMIKPGLGDIGDRLYLTLGK